MVWWLNRAAESLTARHRNSELLGRVFPRLKASRCCLATAMVLSRLHVPSPVGSAPAMVVVGDFNSDWQQDLAITNYDETTVTLLLSKGCSTVRISASYNGATQTATLTVITWHGSGVVFDDSI